MLLVTHLPCVQAELRLAGFSYSVEASVHMTVLIALRAYGLLHLDSL